VDPQYLIDVFNVEAAAMESTLRRHPRLVCLFTLDFSGIDPVELKKSYLLLLKMHLDYIRFSVPALRVAGTALLDCTAQDRLWGQRMLAYANNAIDKATGYGHEARARDDMIALGAPPELLAAPAAPAAIHYARYLIEDVSRHPYAVLGCKGVFDGLWRLVGGSIVRGIETSAVLGGAGATRFFSGLHRPEGASNRLGMAGLRLLEEDKKQFQALQGAHFTSGVYRTMLAHALTSTWPINLPTDCHRGALL